MKPKLALFQTLVKDMLFIEARIADTYYIFEKIDPSSAKIYGASGVIVFSRTQNVIIVSETTFARLTNEHEFLFMEAARKKTGFDPAEDIHVKMGVEYATDPLPERVVRYTNIPPDEKVIDLAHTFNFRREIISELNI